MSARPPWRRAAARLAFAGYWVTLAIATHLPQHRVPVQVSVRDKVVHLAAFAVLATLAWVAGLSRQSGPRVALAGAGLVAYGWLDEYTQQFVGRYTELLDAVANTIGIVGALLVLAMWRRYRGRSG